MRISDWSSDVCSSDLTVKAIAGEVDDGRGGSVRGPIAQPATDPLYLDVALDAGAVWEYALPEGHNAFAYVFEGGATIGEGDDARTLATHEMGVLEVGRAAWRERGCQYV